MELKAELKYTKSHEWIAKDGDVATIGLTDYAQSELGDLVFVNLPEEGEEVTVGEAFGDVESGFRCLLPCNRHSERCQRRASGRTGKHQRSTVRCMVHQGN